MKPFRIMFICTGNICRSPLAHAVFQRMVDETGLSDRIHVGSSGTDAYHVGEQADSRMRSTAAAHGLDFSHRAQRLKRRDIEEYDLLLTMDADNHRNTLALCRSEDEARRVRMFRDFDPEGRGDVPDPWYGGISGFELVWDMVERTCAALLEDIRRRTAA